jgi:type VI secretion system protein ImpK
LYERIRQVLHEPAPVPAVLTCFHRVLLLGFRGRYQDPVSADREKLVAMLSERVAPFRVSPETALLNGARPRENHACGTRLCSG